MREFRVIREPGFGNGFARRQVVLGFMWAVARPCTVTEIMNVLHRADFAIDNKQVSDLLRQQTRRGRVVRHRRGVYEAVQASVSRSTRQRAIRAATRRGVVG